MNTLKQNEDRVERYLIGRMGRTRRLIDRLVSDPRSCRGRRHRHDAMLVALIAGLLKGCESLRSVERLSERLGLGRKRYKISDTAFAYLLERLDDEALLPLLVRLVKDMQHRGQLCSDDLGRDWVAIDGKYESLDHHVGGVAQKFEDREAKTIYWRLGQLRAVLISAPGRPVLGQRTMRPVPGAQGTPEELKHTGEMTNIRPFVAWMREQYGDLATNFSLDAGLWSRDLFAEMDQQGLGIFGNIKNNKPELATETERVLRIERQSHGAEVDSGWERTSRGMVRRRMWRCCSLDGWNGWRHLRQVIVVEQTTRPHDGSAEEVEMRYFGTNLPKAAMSARQLLALVRRHWSIENDCNWTLDVIMNEDDGAWCTTGSAMLSLGVLRMIAHNMLQWLRKRHVTVRHVRIAPTPMPWAELHELIAALWVRMGTTLLERLRTPAEA
ncbi:MAG: ISAs1 family transposase [Planctomycetota bacterium]